MNVRPANYSWPEFYDLLVDLSRYSFSMGAIRRRLMATPGVIPRWMNVVRAMSSEGWGRIEYHTTIRRLLDTDSSVRDFMEGRTDRLPGFYEQRIRRDLGELFAYLPAGGMMHDPNAYLKTSAEGAPVTQLKGGWRRPRVGTQAAVPSS